MQQQIILGCLPFLLAIAGCLTVLVLLVRLSGSRLQLAYVKRLHRDQRGGVQSLSFVLTLPLFIIFMMFIVQLSQITIGKVVVEYAGFSAARSAMVWIPAYVEGEFETENRISTLVYLGEVSEAGGPYSVYEIQPGSPKHNKITTAAAMACMPICPSRTTGAGLDHVNMQGLSAISRAYHAAAPAQAANSMVDTRLRNKWGYALANTRVRILIQHKEDEPPLAQHEVGPYLEEFEFNETGWQDQIIVTVAHDFALLPGPGRLLARPPRVPVTGAVDANGQSARTYQHNSVSRAIRNNAGVWVYPLTSTVRLSNEGEKPLVPFIHRVNATTPLVDTPLPDDGATTDFGDVPTFNAQSFSNATGAAQ